VPPDQPDVLDLLRQAAARRAAGDLPGSLVPLREAARRAPDQKIIQHDLGLTLASLGDLDAALRHFDRAVALDGRFGAAHFQRGKLLEAQGLPGAASAYGAAAEAGLDSPDLFLRLASMLYRAGMRDEAASLYHRAAALAPETDAGRLARANAALIEGRLDEAERLFRQCLRAQPGLRDARSQLAHILAARGAFAEAETELLAALRHQPENIGLFYDLVKTRPVTPDDAPLLARMQAARATPAEPTARIRLHLALAKAHDDLRDFPAAAAALDEADTLRMGISRFDRAAVTQRGAQIRQIFTPTYMAHPQHVGRDSNMPILLVGMPRSGTTLLERILARHPDVAGAGEVHFWEAQGRAFIQAADCARGADLRAVADAYLDRLAQAAPGRARVVDKMPYNFAWAPLVHLALPAARIIHCRRNPADTCLSILSADLTETESFSAVRDNLLFYYRFYQLLAAHARALLAPESWLDVTYEELVAAPEAAIRRVLEFCGLNWHPACLSPERADNAIRTFSQWQARQKIFAGSAGRRRHYDGWLEDFEALGN
jgi:tetratricopeptide (TPR) repeat protein